MTDSRPAGLAALPERTRLLHIGPMKTGTSALQTAARDRRQQLLDHGVRYPGTRTNHRTELGALLGISTVIRDRTEPLGPDNVEVDEGGVPEQRHWETLQREIEAETERRILLTHEFVSQADELASRRVIDALGTDRLHVAITVRAPTVILPSFWSQNVKNAAESESLENWLHRLYTPQPGSELPAGFLRGYDQGELVQRWAKLVGPENVTVIVVDRTKQDLLTDTFETLLDLPNGLLAKEQDTNRSLSATEAAVFRRLNRELYDSDVDWRTYNRLVDHGALVQGVLPRATGTEPRLRLPEWANERAQQDGQRFAERIRESEARVVGDLEALSGSAPTRTETDDETIPTDIAVRALTGTVLAGRQERERIEKRAGKFEQRATTAQTRNKKLTAERTELDRELQRERKRTLRSRVRKLPRTKRIEHAVETHTTSELLTALGRRLPRTLSRTASRTFNSALRSPR